MSNYTKENLIAIPPAAVPAGTLAIKVGNEIFTPGNIKISSGSSMDFYKCASVDTTAKTWTGYKAVLTDGVYTFEETLTEGLAYGAAYTPVAGKIYNTDVTVIVDGLWLGSSIILENGRVFYNDLSSLTGWDCTDCELVDDDNRKVIQTNGGSSHACWRTDPGVPLGNSARTLSFWFKSTGDNGSAWCGAGYGMSGSGNRYTWGLYNKFSVLTLWAYDNFQTESGQITDQNWHHIATTYNGDGKNTQYLDGTKIWEWTATPNTQWEYIHLGDPWESYACYGRFADMSIYNRELPEEEIRLLHNAQTV